MNLETKEKLESLQLEYNNLKSHYDFLTSIISNKQTNNYLHAAFTSLLSEKLIPFVNKVNGIDNGEKLILHLKKAEDQIKLIDSMRHINNKTIVAVSGGFSSGKSSFLNSLFSQHDIFLPVGIQPTTAFPTYVLHSDNVRIVGYAFNENQVEIPQDIYQQLFHGSVQQFDFNLRDVLPFIALETPIDRYQNLSFIDLPGYNPSNSNGYEKDDSSYASEFMSKAHCFLWVIGIDANGTIPQSDLDFLDENVPKNARLYIILNKADLKPLTDMNKILNEIKNELDILGINFEGISAYDSNFKKAEILFDKKSLYEVLSDWNKPQDIYRVCTEEIKTAFTEYKNAFLLDIENRKKKFESIELIESDLKELDLGLCELQFIFNQLIEKNGTQSPIFTKFIVEGPIDWVIKLLHEKKNAIPTDVINSYKENSRFDKIREIGDRLDALSLDYDIKKREGELDEMLQIWNEFTQLLATDNVTHLKNSAKKGNISAQYSLAELYFHGEKIPKNLDIARKWYEIAAAKGHLDAKYRLGMMFLDDSNYINAKKYFEEAAGQEHKDAQYELAQLYYYGLGIDKSFKQAIYWYGKASRQGQPKSQHCLGMIHLADQNYNNAKFCFESAAKQGNKDAQYELAELYYSGHGVDEDEVLATCWYEKAAEQEHMDAQYKLAERYYCGYGVASDEIQAKNWYKKAAAQGHITAQYELAELYLNDYHANKDNEKSGYWYKKAKYWYMKSAEQGHLDAKNKLDLFRDKTSDDFTEKTIEISSILKTL